MVDGSTAPVEFGACDGTSSPHAGVSVGQQPRTTFGLCYRTKVGNDEEANAGYKLHLVYGCTASPSERDYASINDSPAPVTFSWDFTSIPVAVTGLQPTSLIVIDSTVVDPDDLSGLEDLLYGNGTVQAALPLPDAVIALFAGGGS